MKDITKYIVKLSYIILITHMFIKHTFFTFLTKDYKN